MEWRKSWKWVLIFSTRALTETERQSQNELSFHASFTHKFTSFILFLINITATQTCHTNKKSTNINKNTYLSFNTLMKKKAPNLAAFQGFWHHSVHQPSANSVASPDLYIKYQKYEWDSDQADETGTRSPPGIYDSQGEHRWPGISHKSLGTGHNILKIRCLLFVQYYESLVYFRYIQCKWKLTKLKNQFTMHNKIFF